MGRIKSLMVKKAAKKLVAEQAIYDSSFEHNKKLLHGQFPSKPIRNKIAGYITRLIKMKQQTQNGTAKQPAITATTE
ncbi:MAG: 30S ribosomal protein S17e [Candidatus Pacearchaeota archaeon]